MTEEKLTYTLLEEKFGPLFYTRASAIICFAAHRRDVRSTGVGEQLAASISGHPLNRCRRELL